MYKSIIILCTIKCITCTQCTFLHISLYCKSLFKVFSCYCIYPTNTTLHSYLVSTPSAMTDQERDEIDSAAEEFIHSCSEKIETLHHRGDTCTYVHVVTCTCVYWCTGTGAGVMVCICFCSSGPSCWTTGQSSSPGRL